MNEPRWRFPGEPGERAAGLAAALGIGLPAAKILCAGGMATRRRRAVSSTPRWKICTIPTCMAGMDAAVARIRRAIDAREGILIYGDYDVDGTTSVVVLKKAIELAGGQATFCDPAPAQGRLRDAAGSGGGGRGFGRSPGYQRGYGHTRRRGGAAGGRAGHRRNRHGPPPARSGTAARAGGAQPQPPGLRLPGEEPLRRGGGVQAGAGAAGYVGLAGRQTAAGYPNRS